MNGIFIVQSAHLLLIEGISMSREDYALMVNATFTILYLPMLCIVYCSLCSKMGIAKFLICSSVVFAAVFVFLYYKIFIVASMPVMSYANLIWQIEFIFIVLFINELWSGTSKSDFAASSMMRSHRSLLKVWCIVLTTPYLVALIANIMPFDNFLIPYRPLMSSQIATQLANLAVLSFYMSVVLRLKVSLNKKRGTSVSPGKVEDLAY